MPESDYRQAQSQYQEAAARVPELERQIAQQENFISVLLGRNPGPIQRGRDIDALLFPVVPDGLPASLLERRPDIRQAEQNLIAANADIGVAKAAYFPDISLTGFLGLESAQLSDLFKGPSRSWSFGAGLLQPIFNAGRIDSQVARAEALQRQALFTYERSIISAFQDVDNALVDRAKFGQVREEQAKNVLALFRFRDLAVLRYTEGATIYLEVANAEQSLFIAQLAYVATQSQLFQSYVNLYKAMGGGWVEDAEKLVGTGVRGNADDNQPANLRIVHASNASCLRVSLLALCSRRADRCRARRGLRPGFGLRRCRSTRHCERNGGAAVPALLHGYAETSRMWKPLAKVLAPRFTVIAPDLPGIGASSIPKTGLDMKTSTERVHAAVRALGY